MEPIWTQKRGEDPLLAAAIHDGHAVRDEIAQLLALSDAGRLREEDPHTGAWTHVAVSRIVGTRSRFEVDLNRPRETAVYRTPDDAWGLEVWSEAIPEECVVRSLDAYDAFYRNAHQTLSAMEEQHRAFVVFDLHSYNHRRNGPDSPPADPEANPQVNIGTGTMDRDRWGAVVDRFMTDLHAFEFPGGHLDVRENVKFRGGQFSRWVHESFPKTGCAIAIEFKKFFMDEWTGTPDREQIDAIRRALQSTVPGVLEEIKRL